MIFSKIPFYHCLQPIKRKYTKQKIHHIFLRFGQLSYLFILTFIHIYMHPYVGCDAKIADILAFQVGE